MIDLMGEAAVRSGALAMVLWLGIALFRLNSPQVEKMIWMTVLVGALVMPALLHWPLMHALQVTSFALPSIVIHGLHVADISSRGPAIVTLVYVSVSLTLFLRLAIGVSRMWHIRRRAGRIREAWTLGADVRVAPQLSSPATFGSTILLPASYTSWADSKRAVILAHEQAHVRHRDSQIQWLAAVHACIFWFSPLAWWLRRRLAELAEEASDDVVLNRMTDKAGYATVLLEMAQARPTRWVVVPIANGSVAKRIERILSAERAGKVAPRWHRILAVVSVVPVIALAADVTPLNTPSHTRAASAESLFGMSAAGPHIVSSPSLEDLEKYYPPVAEREGIDGDVQVTVKLDDAGRATDTLVLSETPLGMGFGEAALGLAHVFKYSNPTGHPASLTYHVKFALDNTPALPAAKSDIVDGLPTR